MSEEVTELMATIGGANCLSHADFILAGSGDVSHPRQSLVAALLNDLQVAHLQPESAHVKPRSG